MKRIFIGLALALGILFPTYFLINDGADDAAQHMKNIKSDIRLERDMQQTLRAEWSSLNSPQRLQKLAQQYLSLGQMKVSQIGNAWQSKSPATLTSLEAGENQFEPSQ
ncbi:MAG: hypothetical protein HAW65_03140 [Alphaproteobacteria bacterium]|nr:hypothetical protein [Alphaproteobacteria bacterium]MBE8220285.1 hypothetical protein [Alphaproteobacteria bacterium]